jgi:hypothetical protein
MMYKINAIIFDVGGVLVENPKYREFWNKAKGSEELRRLFGMKKISEKEFIRRKTIFKSIRIRSSFL